MSSYMILTPIENFENLFHDNLYGYIHKYQHNRICAWQCELPLHGAAPLG